MASQDQVFRWVKESLTNQDFNIKDVHITGSTGNDQGYMGEVIFVEAEGVTNEGSEKKIHLVVKHGKINEHLRKTTPVREVFVSEIYTYDNIFPVFQKFQKERGVEIFDSVPKCYKCLMFEHMEVIVLQNLKKVGYDLHDRKKPMDIDHLEIVLKEYGKFHATSFAMRDQDYELFEKLTENLPNVYKSFMELPDIDSFILSSTAIVIDILKKYKDEDLCKKFEKLMERGITNILMDVVDIRDPKAVICHGDCWNNNFMFKYENEDKKKPSRVSILDWQISTLWSPVYDLSYFLYAVCSTDQLVHFDDLLVLYYDSFSTYLSQLGSNPEELFPFSELKEHWKKYSIFGLIQMTIILRFALCDKEDAPSLTDLTEDSNFAELLDSIPVTEEDLFYERMKAVMCHYFDSTA
ncbi:unnamed protein product [Phaedon cochleariae]|uniref:CHK kinase-like domain-containing protein n=1 Tax=Phaedon cochleariae TaxID=80249 RepID=A0A9P0DK06_PHACE|nr:unnamed protein product [Phaedon cochleariae]